MLKTAFGNNAMGRTRTFQMWENFPWRQ
jgi:hypothetical protein